MGLYTPLPILDIIWEDLSIDFVSDSLEPSTGPILSFVIVDKFLKMTHFVACKRTNDAINVARLFFHEIVRLHGVPRTITSDKDVKFVSCFWRELWKRLNMKVKLSST